MSRNTIVLIALLLLALTNLTAFLLMHSDKRRAQRGARRISERTLFLSAACFGGLGGVLGMRVFRHKTRHIAFKIGFPLIMVVQMALLVLGEMLLFR